MKCVNCDNFNKHPYYEKADKYKEGHCIASDGQIGPHSYVQNPEKETECCLFRSKAEEKPS